MAFQGAHRGKIACMPRLLAKTPQKATLPQKPPIWGAPIPPGLNVKAKKKTWAPDEHIWTVDTKGGVLSLGWLFWIRLWPLYSQEMIKMPIQNQHRNFIKSVLTSSKTHCRSVVRRCYLIRCPISSTKAISSLTGHNYPISFPAPDGTLTLTMIRIARTNIRFLERQSFQNPELFLKVS